MNEENNDDDARGSSYSFQLKSFSNKLRHFTLYESDQRFYLVGCDVTRKHYRILKLDKQFKYINTNNNTSNNNNSRSGGGGSHQPTTQLIEDASSSSSSLAMLNISEDAGVYTLSQMNHLLNMIHLSSLRSSQNQSNTGANSSSNSSNSSSSSSTNSTNSSSNGGGVKGLVKRVSNAHGLLGFIKFTHGYYLILVTEKKKVGMIASHSFYEIAKTELIPLFVTIDVSSIEYTRMNSSGGSRASLWIKNQASSFFQKRLSLHRDDEQKYKEIFMGLDLTKDFYFSYTYDMTNTLQRNMMMMSDEDDNSNHHQQQKSMFEWNSFLMKPFKERIPNNAWLLPIVHGHFGQSTLSVFGKIVNIVLIGRRSRYFAGTRYLKRGISDNGYVANHVETEQIMYDQDSLSSRQSKGLFSSFVQTRGSIPLYWSQAIVTKMVNPKPEIVMGKFDPLYTASAKHFDNLLDRYGTPVCCLDLVKTKEKKPKEQVLGDAYRVCVDYLNQIYPLDKKVKYTSWDFRRAIKEKPEKALNELTAFAEENFESTGMFCSRSLVHKDGYCLQNGVLRTNCIDCLDRTNIAQFFVGKYALGQQLYAMGILDSPHLVYYPDIVRILMVLYDQMGDKIALQYGGSRTVSAGINHRGYSWDLLTSLTRYYSNNFKDTTKQHAMNLFLGNFVPNSHQNMPLLWYLDTDTYLHDNDKSDSSIMEEYFIPERDDTEQIEDYYEEVYGQHKVSDLEGYVEYNDMTTESPRRNSKKLTADSPRQSLENNNAITESDTQKKETDIDVEDTFDYVADSTSQAELLTHFEGKMNEPSIIHSELTHNDSFVKDLSKNMLRYQKENETVIQVMSHEQKDIDLLKMYVNEYSGDKISSVTKTTRRTINNKKRTILEPTETALVSQKALQSESAYESYMNRFSPKRGNLTRSELLSKDYALYQQYLNVRTSDNMQEQKKEQYQNLIKTGDADAFFLETARVNSYPHPHFTKLQPFFTNLDSNQQLSTRIAQIIYKMRNEMTIVDRVRHPRPAKKKFSQIGLLELLKGRLYRHCFLGCHAIDWVIKNSGHGDYIQKRVETREEARSFLQILLEAYVFHHVAFARSFLDGHYLYKFASDDPVSVLNMHQLHHAEARPALVVSLDALAKVTEIYQEMFLVDQRSLSIKGKHFFEKLSEASRNVIYSARFKRFLEVLCELQRVDLHLPRRERLCFFLNIYNALLLHGLLISSLAPDSKLHGMATHSFYRRICYQIGGFKFSLSDIRDGVLRNNKSYPNTYIPVFTSMDGIDPRLRFCISPEEVRILFLLDKVDHLWNTEGYVTIPRVGNEQLDSHNIYHTDSNEQYENVFSHVEPRTLEAVLQREAEDFCMANIFIDPNTYQINLPSLFGIYCDDFGGSDKAVIQTCYHLTPPSSLLRSQLSEMFEVENISISKSSLFNSNLTSPQKVLPNIGYN